MSCCRWGRARFDGTGFVARIEPYRSRLAVGEVLTVEVIVRNPFPRAAQAFVGLVVPDGWAV